MTMTEKLELILAEGKPVVPYNIHNKKRAHFKSAAETPTDGDNDVPGWFW